MDGYLHTDIAAINCGLRGPESQAYIFIPSPTPLPSAFALALDLRIEKNMRLLLIGTFALHSQLGSHCEFREEVGLKVWCWKG